VYVSFILHCIGIVCGFFCFWECDCVFRLIFVSGNMMYFLQYINAGIFGVEYGNLVLIKKCFLTCIWDKCCVLYVVLLFLFMDYLFCIDFVVICVLS
jgi:hypothetical protein